MANEYRLTDVDWVEDAARPMLDWQHEVANGDTRLGYWDWVEHNRERADCRNSGPYYIPEGKP